jgi:hypothetical protein
LFQKAKNIDIIINVNIATISRLQINGLKGEGVIFQPSIVKEFKQTLFICPIVF